MNHSVKGSHPYEYAEFGYVYDVTLDELVHFGLVYKQLEVDRVVDCPVTGENGPLTDIIHVRYREYHAQPPVYYAFPSVLEAGFYGFFGRLNLEAGTLTLSVTVRILYIRTSPGPLPFSSIMS